MKLFTQGNVSASANHDWTFNLGDSTFRVVDGDTIREVGGEDRTIRIRNLQSPETVHAKIRDDELVGYSTGHVGGLHAKNVLYNTLKKGEFDSLDDVKTQTVGGGAGRRLEADIVRSDTGEDITGYLLANGLAAPTKWSTEKDVDLYNTGELIRSIHGERDEDLAKLRRAEPVNTNPFKTRARERAWYRPIKDQEGQFFEPTEYWSDAEFYRNDEDWQGSALNPLSTKFVSSYHDAVGSFGGAIAALGTLTDIKLFEDYGDTVATARKLKQLDAPWTKINEWGDISDESESTADYIFNTVQWAGGHVASALPYIGTLLAASAATLVALPAGTPAAVTFAAAATPSAALHAGMVWNDIDPDKKTPENAGWAFAAGAAAGALERLGLKGIIKPSQLLTKAGQQQAVAHIAKTRGISKAEALKIFNSNLRAESIDFMTHARRSAQKELLAQRSLVNVLGNISKRVGVGASSEALTEALQESTTYLTAAAINREPKSASDLLNILKEEIGNEDFQRIIKESARAGGVLGGGIATAGAGFDEAGISRTRALYSDAKPDAELSDIQKAILSHDVSSLEDEQMRLRDEFIVAPERYKGKFSEYEKKGRDSTASKRIHEGTSGILQESWRFGKSIFAEPFRKEFTDQVLKDSKAASTLYSIMSGIRATYSGQSVERRAAAAKGKFDAVGSVQRIATRHGFNWQNERAAANFYDKLVKFAKKTDVDNGGKNYRDLTDQDLQEIGISRDEVKAYNQTAFERKQQADTMYNDELRAIIENYGANSPQAKNFKKRNDWWYTHRQVDPDLIRKDTSGFKELVKRRYKARQAQLTPEEKALGADLYADYLTDAILDERPLTDFTHVGDDAFQGVRKSRTLDLQADSKFNDFAMKNGFAGIDQAAERTALKISHLEAFGDKGSKLDVLFTEMDAELEAKGYTKAQREDILGRGAARIKDMTDAMTGNYKPIKNKALNVASALALSATALLSMPFSMLASIAESFVPLLLMGTRHEWGSHFGNIFKDLGDGLKRTVINARTWDYAQPGKYPRVEARFFDLLQKIGAPQDVSAIRRRVGTGEQTALSQRIRKTLDTFFWIVGLVGLTEAQRNTAVATGLDIMRSRIETLMGAVDADGNISSNLQTREHDALKDMQRLGINVPQLIKDFHALEKSNDSAIYNAFADITGGTNPTTEIDTRIQAEIEKGLLDFVNTVVQDPNASNRTVWVQDPRFRIFTQFNSFLSAATNTYVPLLWNDGFGRALRRKQPQLAYNTFLALSVLILAGAGSQYLRDLLKYGEASPYLSDDPARMFQRAVGASGVLGQFEKIIEVFHPLYPQRGEGVIGRTVGTALGPAGRHAEVLTDIATPAKYGDTAQEFWNDVFKFLPITASSPTARDWAIKQVTGDN